MFFSKAMNEFSWLVGRFFYTLFDMVLHKVMSALVA